MGNLRDMKYQANHLASGHVGCAPVWSAVKMSVEDICRMGACAVFGRLAGKAESIAGHLHDHHQWNTDRQMTF
jgi:hypothetical protein